MKENFNKKEETSTDSEVLEGSTEISEKEVFKKNAEQFQNKLNAHGDKLEIHSKEINRIKKEIKELEKRTEEYKKSLAAFQFRSIESIGLIASIIALILVYVNVGSRFSSRQDAYLVLILATMSLIIFASLLDYFLNIERKRDLSFWIAFIILPLITFALIGFLIYCFQ